VRLSGRQLQVGDFQVLVEGLAECRGTIREPASIGLVQQAAKRRGSGRVVRAGLPEAALAAGDWVYSGVDVHTEGTTW
jgi:hypothetical protein